MPLLHLRVAVQEMSKMEDREEGHLTAAGRRVLGLLDKVMQADQRLVLGHQTMGVVAAAGLPPLAAAAQAPLAETVAQGLLVL